MLIDEQLPAYDFAETHGIGTRAALEAIFRAIKETTPGEIALLRLLFDLRALPGRLIGRRGRDVVGERPLLEQMLGGGAVVLAEEPGRELVIGLIGRFWLLRDDAPPRLTDARAFHTFDRPDYARAVLNFHVGARGGDVTIVSTRTRIRVPDPGARRKFARYWRLIAPGSALTRMMWLRAIKRRAERDRASLPSPSGSAWGMTMAAKRRASAGDRWSAADVWGATAAECVASYPCDSFLPEYDIALFRAVDVRAPAPLLFRWLCQLRVAPYSYDWLDNIGRRSPRRLGRGLDELAPGQRVMTIFRLVNFERDRHLTLVLDSPWAVALFGELALSYMVVPRAGDSCRLVVKLLARKPQDGDRARPSFPPRLPVQLLAWGDLLMMRKQLLTLKGLAEAGYARAHL